VGFNGGPILGTEVQSPCGLTCSQTVAKRIFRHHYALYYAAVPGTVVGAGLFDLILASAVLLGGDDGGRRFLKKERAGRELEPRP